MTKKKQKQKQKNKKKTKLWDSVRFKNELAANTRINDRMRSDIM